MIYSIQSSQNIDFGDDVLRINLIILKLSLILVIKKIKGIVNTETLACMKIY